ncbi:MAG: hypothetical protein HC795_18255 [Coleofasciculaceae cyanobacterium RL_1_1]|nr:hypothetical protein [Coleofasciculaceae cyanobacterium RL_1_1]
MSTTPKTSNLSAKNQALLAEIHQELTAALAFYASGSRQFSPDIPFALCAELAERHIHKLEQLLDGYGLSIESDHMSDSNQLPIDLHEACHTALTFALERDRRYKHWIDTINNTDIHQLLCNIEHGIHDRGIPSFKQYLEHHNI